MNLAAQVKCENKMIMGSKAQVNSAKQNKKTLEKERVIVADVLAVLKAKKTYKDAVCFQGDAASDEWQAVGANFQGNCSQ